MLLNEMQAFFVSLCRSSRPEVFCKKGVLRNFSRFTGKHLCQSLFFNKVVSESPVSVSFLKKSPFFHGTPLVAASVYAFSR